MDPTPRVTCRPATHTLLPAAPSALSAVDTHTLSAGTLPSHPALSQGIPIRSLPAPPPRPRLRRSSPAPATGAWAVRGDIRGAAVSGVEPVGSRIRFFSGISPCTGPWGYRHGGWGRRGGGTRSPSPVSHAPGALLLVSPIPPGLQPAGYPYALCRHPHPRLRMWLPIRFSGPLLSHPVLSQGIPIRSLPAPPPRPRLRRSSPAPAAGGGSVRGDIRGAAVSGV